MNTSNFVSDKEVCEKFISFWDIHELADVINKLKS